MTQLPLFDLAAGRAARDVALDRVEAGAGDWTDQARAAVEAVARAQGELTVDDVWSTGLPKPREGRALGPVILWAARCGLIRSTETFRPSTIAHYHACPRRVWRSNVYVEVVDA